MISKHLSVPIVVGFVCVQSKHKQPAPHSRPLFLNEHLFELLYNIYYIYVLYIHYRQLNRDMKLDEFPLPIMAVEACK